MSTFFVSLPTADRARTHAFYSRGMGFETPGEPAEDGVPEPLVVAVDGKPVVVFIPTGGFGWVTGGRETAGPDTHEVLLSLAVRDAELVDVYMVRAANAGGTVVIPAGPQPWGYSGTLADPDGHLWQVTAL